MSGADAAGSPGVVEVRSATMLAASRDDIELHTADGLTLVGELALPADRPPAGLLVTLHPLPTHGGFMDSHVYRKAAARLPALAGIGVLRFNTRGTASPRGRSEGAFDRAEGERHDLAAALDFVATRGLPRPWVVGWSFGTEVALKWATHADIAGVILLSPPLHTATDADLAAWNTVATPIVALVPEFDDYLRPAEAAARFALVPRIEVVPVEGGKHLWVGESQVRRVLEEIVARVNPAALPLPTVVPAELVV